MSTVDAGGYLAQVLETQADDMFALYQLLQLLSDTHDVDELAHLALAYLARVSDSPYTALILQREPGGALELVAWVGADGDDPWKSPPEFADQDSSVCWFQEACGLGPANCVSLTLDVGRQLPGLLLLAAPSLSGITRHQQHLMATMAREVERMLKITLARSDVERRHQQVERMRDDFVAAVSHELRTPLALIQASIDSLLHLHVDEQQRRRFVDDIAQSTFQLTRTVNAILSFSRIDEAPWPLAVETLDLGEAVARTVDEYGAAIQARLVIDVPPIDVRADSARLARTVINVLDNALKYSAVEMPVHMRAGVSYRRRVAWLHIHDRGRGVPVEDLPSVTQKFFRARNVRESSLGGTGLGLYLARRLIEEQGGTIRIRSRLGRGTTVRITLPLGAG